MKLFYGILLGMGIISVIFLCAKVSSETLVGKDGREYKFSIPQNEGYRIKKIQFKI